MPKRRIPKPGELYCWECGTLSSQVTKGSDGIQLCPKCRH
jgi:Zn finger protein HypA/HybF involved in hydrogenase expression